MKTTKNKHAGGGFDDFLRKEGLLAESEAVALKRVLAYQLEKEFECVSCFDPFE
jgi:hypothetical protein